MVTTNREKNRVFLIDDCVVDVLRDELAALNGVLELFIGPHVDVLHVVSVVLHDLVQSSRVSVLRATVRLALMAADRSEHERRKLVVRRTKEIVSKAGWLTIQLKCNDS